MDTWGFFSYPRPFRRRSFAGGPSQRILAHRSALHFAASYSSFSTHFNFVRRSLERFAVASAILIVLFAVTTENAPAQTTDIVGPGRIQAQGRLADLGDGFYGAAEAFQGAAGQALILHVTRPFSEARNWSVQIVEIATGTVIAADFTGWRPQYPLYAVLPRRGEYAIVLASPLPGSYTTSVQAIEAERGTPRRMTTGERVFTSLPSHGHRYTDGRTFSKYLLDDGRAGAFRLEVRGVDCAPEIRVRSRAEPSQLVATAEELHNGPVPGDGLDRRRIIATFSLPASPAHYQIEIGSAPGAPRVCDYDYLLTRVR
jgi:hypothetical protein